MELEKLVEDSQAVLGDVKDYLENEIAKHRKTWATPPTTLLGLYAKVFHQMVINLEETRNEILISINGKEVVLKTQDLSFEEAREYSLGQIEGMEVLEVRRSSWPMDYEGIFWGAASEEDRLATDWYIVL